MAVGSHRLIGQEVAHLHQVETGGDTVGAAPIPVTVLLLVADALVVIDLPGEGLEAEVILGLGADPRQEVTVV